MTRVADSILAARPLESSKPNHNDALKNAAMIGGGVGSFLVGLEALHLGLPHLLEGGMSSREALATLGLMAGATVAGGVLGAGIGAFGVASAHVSGKALNAIGDHLPKPPADVIRGALIGTALATGASVIFPGLPVAVLSAPIGAIIGAVAGATL